MLEIKVTIEAQTLAEAINNLAGVMGSTARISAVVDAQAAQSAAVETQTNATLSPMNPHVQAAQSAPTVPTQAPTSTPTPAKSYTVDDISRAGAALIDQGKMPQLLELLKKYGVQAVTQLNANVYPAFVEEMKALGAQL